MHFDRVDSIAHLLLDLRWQLGKLDKHTYHYRYAPSRLGKLVRQNHLRCNDYYQLYFSPLPSPHHHREAPVSRLAQIDQETMLQKPEQNNSVLCNCPFYAFIGRQTH